MLSDDLDRFSRIPHSEISDHDELCCRVVRVRLLARLDRGSIQPSLSEVPAVVEWSPIGWPAFWCDLAEGDDGFRGDCGVHAALARMLMSRYGVVHAAAKVALISPPEYVAHWRETWRESQIPATWIGEGSVYHEVVAVGSRLWDPSESRFIRAVGAGLLSGRVAAIRIGEAEWVVE